MTLSFKWTSGLKVLVIVVLSLAPASLPRGADAGVDHIAVLDSLTGDTTIVDGGVVYVDFWASWCVPCRKSFPWMMELLNRYGESGLQIVAVNVDRKRSDADKFLQDTGTSLPVVFDPDGKLAKLYDLQVMPTSFVYGRDGTLRLQQDGFNPGETNSVESLIRELLKENPKK
jgi:thiol-disulfide isomerase/thioredoxin